MSRKQRNCFICNNDTPREVLGNVKMIVDRGNPLPDEYEIVCCEECGFCFADTIAQMEDYEKYYRDCNEYSTTPKDTSIKDVLFGKMIEASSEYISLNKNIMDVGVGRAELLKELYHKGYTNLYGMDPSDESICVLKEMKGIQAIKGSVYDLQNDLRGKMQFIFIIDVLEHLLRADLAVENLYRMLEVGGYVFAAVPDYGNMYLDNTHKANNFNCEHINYFSENSLDNLFLNKGFTKMFYKRVPVKLNENSTIGTMWAIYQKGELVIKHTNFEYASLKSIKDYLLRDSMKKQRIDEKVDQLYRLQMPILIWGTGNYTMQLLKETRLGECNIRGFIDNNIKKVGNIINDIQVYSVEDISNLINAQTYIIICSMLSSEDIYNQIINMEIGNEIIIL